MRNFFLFFLLFAFHTIHGYELNLLVDRYFSPTVGALDLMSLQDGLIYLSDFVWKDEKDTSKPRAILSRIAKQVSYEIPISLYFSVVQHEVFGHGYRLRSLGKNKATVKGYQIDAPFPYGDGGGATYFTITENFTISNELAVNIAGVEASAVMAGEIRLNWLKNKAPDPTQAILYLNSALDLVEYTHGIDFFDGGNDLSNYIFWLNLLYPGKTLTEKWLKAQSMWSYLDPFAIAAIISYLKYVIFGKSSTLPMLSVGPIRYLAALRFSLTPFGPIKYIENYITYRNRIAYFYYSFGHYNHEVSYKGIGLRIPGLFSCANFSLGFRSDLWLQPNYSDTPVNETLFLIDSPTKNHFGVSFFLIPQYTINRKNRVSAYSELGCKSSGYVEGQDLGSGPILRLGFNMKY